MSLETEPLTFLLGKHLTIFTSTQLRFRGLGHFSRLLSDSDKNMTIAFDNRVVKLKSCGSCNSSKKWNFVKLGNILLLQQC